MSNYVPRPIHCPSCGHDIVRTPRRAGETERVCIVCAAKVRCAEIAAQRQPVETRTCAGDGCTTQLPAYSHVRVCAPCREKRQRQEVIRKRAGAHEWHIDELVTQEAKAIAYAGEPRCRACWALFGAGDCVRSLDERLCQRCVLGALVAAS